MQAHRSSEICHAGRGSDDRKRNDEREKGDENEKGRQATRGSVVDGTEEARTTNFGGI
jgi:hypothetical protein